MYNCIIFDVDGTLIDTEFAVLSSLQKLAFEELNREFSFDELRFALGIPGESALSKIGIANVIEANDKWNEYFKDYFSSIRVFDNINDTLAKLKEMNILMGIVTSKTKDEYNNDFLPYGISEYFSYVVCADDTEKHKPNPDPILKFIEISNSSKTNTIYVGDTKYDMACAYSAGVDFGLALWGANNPSEIKATYNIETPKLLLSLVK